MFIIKVHSRLSAALVITTFALHNAALADGQSGDSLAQPAGTTGASASQAASMLPLAACASKTSPLSSTQPKCRRLEISPSVTTNGGFRRQSSAILKGEVDINSFGDCIGPILEDLQTAALEQNRQMETISKATRHYNSALMKTFKVTKDAVNFMLCNRGFMPSTEVGTVVLDEHQAANSRNRSELARARLADKTRQEIIECLMQMSMGLGMFDRGRASEITGRALVSLNDLVGPDQTNKTFSMLKAWSKRVDVPQSIYSQGLWDIQEHKIKVATITSLAVNKDPICRELTDKIHKYNRHSKLACAGSTVVASSLNLAALSPSLVGPAASAALLVFFMSTGGTEEDKIIREVYLGKRLGSRVESVSQTANLVVSSYQAALLTRNPVLLACSELVARHMSGGEAVDKLFGKSVFKAVN